MLAQLKAEQASVRGVPSLLDFVPVLNPTFESPRHLAPIAEALERASREEVRLCFSVPPQHGKALDVETPILTRRGWLTCGDVVVGDELIASDGGWTRVLAVHPQGVVPLYWVQFRDGKCRRGPSLRACGEHRWAVFQRYGGPMRVRTTEELVGDLREGDDRCKWRVPVVKPLRGERVELPINPYLLGVWLGDGHSAHGAVTSMDPEVFDAFVEAGFGLGASTQQGRATTRGILGLRRPLRLAGLLGNKHVPRAYLDAPVESRLALLQGLCDTDGTVAKNGSLQSYTTTSERLAEGFRELVSGLGGTWSEYSRPAAGKTAYTYQFRLPHDMAAFRLRRKLDRLNAPSGRNTIRRFVDSIEPDGEGEAVCFTVDADDHLFAAGRELVLTHNSVLATAAIVWLLAQDPTRSNAYATYEQNRAWRMGAKVRAYAEAYGLQPSGSKTFWELPEGGSLLSTGVGGPLTGEPISGVVIVDDPHKNDADASSPTKRETVSEWLASTVETRCHPGASIVVVHTRWHPDDLIGTLEQAGTYEVINIPAVNDGTDPRREVGEPLWPEHRPLEWLRDKRERLGEYGWQSLYQGQPKARGGQVFRPASTFAPADLPTHGVRKVIGVDLAYTEETSADWSVAVVMVEAGGRFYVVDVERAQVEAGEFMGRLRALRSRHSDPEVWWRYGGTEKGVAQLLQRSDVPIKRAKITGDKFAMAQPVALAWNGVQAEGIEPRLFVPEAAPWKADFLRVVERFTGVKDKVDDDVDALGTAYDVLAARSRGGNLTRVSGRWS